MTTPSAPDDSPRTGSEPGGDAPFLPPARPVVPAPAAPTPEPAAAPSPAPTPATSASPTDTPFLPSSRPPEPAKPAVAAPEFDAKAMVESQKHFNANPAYGAMPPGSEEGRAAARKLREEANRKRRRSRVAGRLVGLLVLAGLGVGGYFVYQALQDDPPPADSVTDDPDADADGTGEGGALTPLGEQEQVIEALDDVNSGARPSAGGLLEAVEDARDVVGQVEPPVAAPSTLTVADVFTPAVLDHTDVLDPADGWERFVVRSSELEEINPSARAALIEQLLALPQVADGDPQLAVAPVVLPGDVGIAIQRDGDRITRLVAIAVDPPIRAVS